MTTIKFLADHPELSGLVSGWLYDQWGGPDPTRTIEGLQQSVAARLQRDKLPLCLVAFYAGRPVGTASLKNHEVEIRPQYEAWLGNVYVVPEQRGQGIGARLIERAVAEALRMGVRELYLYTREQGSLYARMGWKTIETVIYRDRKATIMKYELHT